MRQPFLFVNSHLPSIALPSESADIFEFKIVSCGQGFLEKVAACSTATPLLLVPDTQLTANLHLTNSRSIFRVLPTSTSGSILTTILLDAARQHALVQTPHQLLERIALLTVFDLQTGCYNRAFLEERLHKELRRSIRYAHPLSIILCNIDGLKEVKLLGSPRKTGGLPNGSQ